MYQTKQMGWFINYEVEFDDHVDWDDGDVKHCLQPFDALHLYLRDLDKPRVMLCLYSQHPIENILTALKLLYRVGMRYHVYNSDEWITFT